MLQARPPAVRAAQRVADAPRPRPPAARMAPSTTSPRHADERRFGPERATPSAEGSRRAPASRRARPRCRAGIRRRTDRARSDCVVRRRARRDSARQRRTRAPSRRPVLAFASESDRVPGEAANSTVPAAETARPAPTIRFGPTRSASPVVSSVADQVRREEGGREKARAEIVQPEVGRYERDERRVIGST